MDDVDASRIPYVQFVGAYSESGIMFSLNTDPEAQNSYKVRIVTLKRAMEAAHGMRDLALP